MGKEMGRVVEICEVFEKVLSLLEDSKVIQRIYGYYQMLGSLNVIMGILLFGLEEELSNEKKEELLFIKNLGQNFILNCSQRGERVG